MRDLIDVTWHFAYRSICLVAAPLVGLVLELDDVNSVRFGVTGGSQGGGRSNGNPFLESGLQRAEPKSPV